MSGSFVRADHRWSRFTLLLPLLLAVAGCDGYSSTTPEDDEDGGEPVRTTSVTVGNNFFDPEDIAVSPGATVTWTWSGGVSHNVTFTSGEIESSATQASGTHQAAMPTTTGSYDYRCTIHPSQMQGSVVVE